MIIGDFNFNLINYNDEKKTGEKGVGLFKFLTT